MAEPKLRFPEFTGDWEQRKLGDIADIVGGGTPSTTNESYWDGEIDWYAPAEIGTQIYLDSSKRKITEDGFNNCSAKMLPVGTVLFTSRAGIGKMAILSKEACTNQGFQSIVPHKNELDSYFIFSRSGELKKYGEMVGAGSTFVEVSGKQMSAMKLMIPPTIEEQKKIGNYFEQYDCLITLQQREIELWEEKKKGVMQKIFSQEVRFKDENGKEYPEWTRHKLGDIVEIKDSARIPNHEWTSSGVPYYRAKDFNGKTLMGELFISFENYKKYLAKTGAPQCGDLMFVSGGNVGLCVVKKDDAPVYVQGGAILYARTSQSNVLLGSFLEQYFESEPMTKYIESAAVGGTITHFTLKPANATPIILPCIEEQEKIVDCLSTIDNVISIKKQKLETWKTIKKGLLQQMFV